MAGGGQQLPVKAVIGFPPPEGTDPCLPCTCRVALRCQQPATATNRRSLDLGQRLQHQFCFGAVRLQLYSAVRPGFRTIRWRLFVGMRGWGWTVLEKTG
jgi:hypothetical protein